MADCCYLVLDTESTVCRHRRRRLLVAVAYEVVWTNGQHETLFYDIVCLPPDVYPDARSEGVHGITQFV